MSKGDGVVGVVNVNSFNVRGTVCDPGAGVIRWRGMVGCLIPGTGGKGGCGGDGGCLVVITCCATWTCGFVGYKPCAAFRRAWSWANPTKEEEE